MTQEPTDPIILAIITLLSGLLLFLLNSFFKLKSEERAKNKQTEDLKLQRRLEVVRTRINDVQVFLDKYLDLQNKMIDLETSVMQIPLPEADHTKTCSELGILIKEIDKKFPPIYSLGDEEVLKASLLIIDLIDSEYKIMSELIRKSIVNEKINQDIEMTRIASFRMKGYEIVAKMTKRLDELSGLS